jgi:hypothetical protein
MVMLSTSHGCVCELDGKVCAEQMFMIGPNHQGYTFVCTRETGHAGDHVACNPVGGEHENLRWTADGSLRKCIKCARQVKFTITGRGVCFDCWTEVFNG